MTRLFLISGSHEYRSAETLPAFVAHLEATGRYQCTLVEAGERGAAIPQIDTIWRHDALLVFTKRMELPPETVAVLRCWRDAGRPLIGLRTASHAFQTWLEFDREWLGGSYNGHGPEETVRMEVADPAHPITAGLTPWSRVDKLYRNPDLAADAHVLLTAQGAAEAEPLAWCRVLAESGSRVFYTSMGNPADFAEPEFVALLERAIAWAAPTPRRGGYTVMQMDEIDPVKCPCGFSRRAFTTPDNPVATLHMVDITVDARTHYHKKLTEIYLILEGEGHMELNGELVPVKPLTAIFLEPGCRHRAVGRMRIVNMPVPSFDPTDEWFD